MTWLALLFLLPPLDAQATSFVEVPFESTVSDAPIVVRGTVGGKRADWGRGSDGRDRIYTYFDLTVRERLKGDPGSQSQILMRELGGEVGGVGMQVSGTAQFQEGEDVVVFLNPPVEDSKGRTSFDVRGMMMGKYGIMRDESGEEVLDGAGVDSLEHPVERDLHRHLEAQGDTKPRAKWTLGKLRDLIRAQANAPEAPSQGIATPHVSAPDRVQESEGSVPAPSLQNPQAEEDPPSVPTEPQSRKGWILAFGIGLGSLFYLLRRLIRRT